MTGPFSSSPGPEEQHARHTPYHSPALSRGGRVRGIHLGRPAGRDGFQVSVHAERDRRTDLRPAARGGLRRLPARDPARLRPAALGRLGHTGDAGCLCAPADHPGGRLVAAPHRPTGACHRTRAGADRLTLRKKGAEAQVRTPNSWLSRPRWQEKRFSTRGQETRKRDGPMYLSDQRGRCSASQASTSVEVRGNAFESTSRPFSVTRTSSSMRTPMPRNSSGTVRSSGWKYRPGSTVSTMPGSRSPYRCTSWRETAQSCTSMPSMWPVPCRV